MFVIKKLISLLLLPPLAPLLVTAAGLLLIRRHPRGGRALAWGGLFLAVALSMPPVVDALVDGLETAPVVTPAQLREAQAIVILSGGARTNAPEFGGQTVSRITLERVRYGARLARESRLPVLVSGGAPSGSEPEALLMKRALEDDFRVPVRWVEDRSLDTRDNARMSAAILRPAGVRKVVLVTHAAHMRRSVEAFEQAGLTVIPAPTAFFHRGPTQDEVVPRMPNMNSAFTGAYAVHEWLGLLAYRLSR
ncbi:YdcF family protein [Zoogloea sp.]|uniref:YdcF family protein n=1 Tax=Zoogloea sp. TaxID=49181 RepID=UPI0035B3A79E